MDIILDNKYNIVKTTDEYLVKGSNNYDNLTLKIPINATNYYPTATFMRRDGRKFGPYISQNQTMDEAYRNYEWILTDNLLAVDGVLQITFNINFTDDTGNVTDIKNVVEVFANIYDAVIVDDVILIGGENAVQNITEQLYLLQLQLDKYKNLWDAKVDVKNGNSEILNDADMIKLTSDKIKFKTNTLVRENTSDNIENEIIDSSMAINDNWIDTNLTI